jgi:adenylate kinase family enzyme
MISNEKIPGKPALDWREENQAFLCSHLKRLRLLVQRRVLWLRQYWRHDPLQSYQGLVISEAEADWLLAGDDLRAEARFYRENSEAVQISQSIAETEREITEQIRLLAEAGRPPALEILVQQFGLTPFERNVLVLCMGPEMDPSFERLYGYVQDDITRKYATPHLALTLFPNEDDPASTDRESLTSAGVLRRFHVVTLESGSHITASQGARPLRLSARIADYLMGVNRLDERAAEFLRPMPPVLLTPYHRDLIERLCDWIEAEGRQTRWPAINIVGPQAAGKAALAKALCGRLGQQLCRLDVSRLPATYSERDEIFRLLEREAILLRFALFVDVTKIEEVAESNLKKWVSEAIDGLNVFLLLGTRERWQAERKMIAVQLPKPDFSSQLALWKQALASVPHTLNGEIEGLVQQFEFGPSTIPWIVEAAQDRARLHSPDDSAKVTADDLWQACREQGTWHLAALAQPILPCYGWDDIVLPEDVFRQLEEIAAQVVNRSRVYEGWGFGAKLNRGRGISALFAGPSGTGKTMAAEILANHLNLNLCRIDLSGVVSKYIGETEKNLRKVFDAAEQSGAILFFDEADALFGKRSEVKDSHDRYVNIEISYLLQRMEDYRGLAILATNMKSLLDQAFLRRLRFLVDFPFPDAAHRARIWQHVFPKKATLEGLDYSLLSRMEITGGNIKNIALNAAFLAADRGEAIRMEHLLKAARREYTKIDKLMQESDFGPYYLSVKR